MRPHRWNAGSRAQDHVDERRLLAPCQLEVQPVAGNRAVPRVHGDPVRHLRIGADGDTHSHTNPGGMSSGAPLKLTGSSSPPTESNSCETSPAARRAATSVEARSRNEARLPGLAPSWP